MRVGVGEVSEFHDRIQNRSPHGLWVRDDAGNVLMANISDAGIHGWDHDQIAMHGLFARPLGQGLGTAFMEALKSYAAASGKAIYVHAPVANPRFFRSIVGMREHDGEFFYESPDYWTRHHATERGGPGSGHYGHEGRPGEVGGSAPGTEVGGSAPGTQTQEPGWRVSGEAEPQEFHSAFNAAFAESAYANHVTHYSIDELAEMKALLLSDDGRTGVAVKDHGDGRIEATALFNRGGPPGAGLGLLQRAVSDYGVNYLEAFGPILPLLYGRVGFEVAEKSPFSTELAPPDWDYDRFDNPDYFTMRLP